MPQASDEDRARYKTYFPDIGPEHAMQTLEERGYKLTKDGHRAGLREARRGGRPWAVVQMI